MDDRNPDLHADSRLPRVATRRALIGTVAGLLFAAGGGTFLVADTSARQLRRRRRNRNHNRSNENSVSIPGTPGEPGENGEP